MLITLANAAIPSCMVSSPAMVLLLYPIILIEAVFIRRWIRPEPVNARGLSIVTNLWSTFFGVPAAVVAAYLLLTRGTSQTFEESSIVGKVGLLIGEGFILGWGEEDKAWMFWTGALLIHAGFCVVSILVEWPLLRWLLRGTKSRGIAKAVIVGNLTTYALLPIGYFIIVLVLMAVVN